MSQHPAWRWVAIGCLVLLLAIAGPWLAAGLALRGSGGGAVPEVSALPPIKPLNLTTRSAERPALPPPTPPELMMQAPYSRDREQTRIENQPGPQAQMTPEQMRQTRVNELSRQIQMGGLEAVSNLRDLQDVDDKTYDEAILRALPNLLRRNPQDAITLLDDFIRNGRMDVSRDPEFYERAINVVKNLGVHLGSRDLREGINLGLQLPADSPAQAYLLSNIAYTNSRQDRLPSLHMLYRLPRGGATRTRVAAGLLYGRLGYHRDTTGQTGDVKAQLDNDNFDLGTLREITSSSSLPPHEQRAILRLIN